MYVDEDMTGFFLTNDTFYKHISDMGTNLTPFFIARGGENIYFSIPRFKFIKREKHNDNEVLKTKESSADPLDYHVSICGKNSFRKLQKYKIHSSYD